jgi:hypothetical protein
MQFLPHHLPKHHHHLALGGPTRRPYSQPPAPNHSHWHGRIPLQFHTFFIRAKVNLEEPVLLRMVFDIAKTSSKKRLLLIYILGDLLLYCYPFRHFLILEIQIFKKFNRSGNLHFNLILQSANKRALHSVIGAKYSNLESKIAKYSPKHVSDPNF